MKSAKSHIGLCGLIILSVISAPVLRIHAQTVHPYGLAQLMTVTEEDLSGTARFIALSGAMTAVGGDPTAVKHNPAGLGIYRHSQFSVSADFTFRRFYQPDRMDTKTWYNRGHLSQASYVFALTHPERVAGVVSNNLMISYAKRADILRNITLNDRGERGTDFNWTETNIDEYGYRHDADFHYAMNISNRVYWGVGMNIEWVQARQTINRWEYTEEDKRGQRREYTLSETAIGKSFGIGGSIGVLVHPVRMLRIGLAVESPVIGKMRETDYYTERFVYPSTPANNSTYDSPDYSSSWQMTTPLKFSAGVGLQWREHGLLSLQYDLQYHKLIGVAHTARAGLEVAVTNHWMIDAGYAYSTLYTRQRASVGVNYMGKWLRVGLAYAHSWSTGQVIDAMYLTQLGVYKTKENKLVLTFQWNS